MRTCLLSSFPLFFFFNDTATTEIYTLSLHDALPIYGRGSERPTHGPRNIGICRRRRSEEHTSELQSHLNLVCRLLLEKKNKTVIESKSGHAVTRASEMCMGSVVG